jgi:hypothetical protein
MFAIFYHAGIHARVRLCAGTGEAALAGIRQHNNFSALQ